MFRNILAAVDGSPQSIRALDAAAELARATRARLTVMTVAILGRTVAVGAPGLARILSDEDAQSHALLDEALDQVRPPQHVEKVITWGPSVPDAILEQAERGEHDLIVLGSRGRGPLRATLLGSVGRRVLDHSAVPVLIVRPQPERAAREQKVVSLPGSR
jgi:nucleotide-binding universal stress UspA family protein